jgi:hypothetical protein
VTSLADRSARHDGLLRAFRRLWRPRSSKSIFGAGVTGALALWPLSTGCDSAPNTTVVLDNMYPSSSTDQMVVYRAFWQAVSFDQPVVPGVASAPENTEPASENTAYVTLAPGWDPASSSSPTAFVVLESRQGFGVHLNETLHIPVDDQTFIGNCAAGSFLSQAQADFITKLVFPKDFANTTYEAASCTTRTTGDATAP